MAVPQERVQIAQCGQFTLRSFSRGRDGHFQATFVITEYEWHGDVEVKRQVGDLYASDDEAVAAGMEAAIRWLRDHRFSGARSHR